MIEWRIYYNDGTEFDNTMGTWASAPGLGIVAVTTRNPTRDSRFVLHNHEYYYKVDHEVMCSEELELVKQHEPNILASQIKRGGNAYMADWHKVMQRAGKDPDFPGKTPQRRSSDPQPAWMTKYK